MQVSAVLCFFWLLFGLSFGRESGRTDYAGKLHNAERDLILAKTITQPVV